MPSVRNVYTIPSLGEGNGEIKCQNVRVRLAHCLMFGLLQKVLMMSRDEKDLYYGEYNYPVKIYFNHELEDLPPLSFLIFPYIVNNSFAVLYGAPASYKSFLALDWALSIAHGLDWNGQAVEEGWVVYLAMEGQQGYKQRVEAWHKNNNLKMQDAKFASVTVPINLTDFSKNDRDIYDLIDDLSYKLVGKDIKLIIIDTLARSFMEKDENSAKDMGLFIKNIDMLKQENGCAILAVHHSGKDSSKGMRGSSVLRGAIDSEFEIKRQSGTMKAVLRVKKQKDTKEVDDLWIEAREIGWVEGALKTERKSLVLDKCDEKPKDFSISPDQKKALVILDEMLEGFQDETDRFGNVGVSEKAWREQLGKELSSASVTKNWGRFKKQFEDRGLLAFENGLVRKTGV